MPNSAGASIFTTDPNVAATIAAQGNPSYTGVPYHTSTQAIPIPIMWGTRRIAPNAIWQSSIISPNAGDVNWPSTTPNDGWGFGGAQFGDSTLQGNLNGAGYHWWSPTIEALCEGPITDLKSNIHTTRVWRGGGAPAVFLDALFSQPDPEIAIETFTGSSTQTPWGFWTVFSAGSGSTQVNLTQYPGQDLAYRLTAYIAWSYRNTGNNNVLPQQSYEVTRILLSAYGQTDSYNIGTDYSLADIIPDLLTSTQYGAGLTSGDIDSASLTQFLEYQFAQGLYFSPLLTAQTPVVDLLDRWATISNTWIYWDGTKIRFVPLGDESLTGNLQTYTPDTTPAYNLGYSDFGELLRVDRADPIDCYNRVRLEFSDRLNDYSPNPIEWKDTTLINLFGMRDAASIDASDICDVAVAAKVVELYGKRLAYIRNSYSFTLSYRYIRILPGTIVTLTDANLGLNAVPVRVRSVEEDEGGKLFVVAEEYPGTLGISRPMPAQAWGVTNTAGGTSGSSGAPTGLGSGVTTSGGTLTMASSMTLVLYVAGDVITLPNPMTIGVPYVFLHDQHRSPQPTPPLCEPSPLGAPVTIQRPGGATYNILDPQDWTVAAASSVTIRVSGRSLTAVNDGAGIVRWII